MRSKQNNKAKKPDRKSTLQVVFLRAQTLFDEGKSTPKLLITLHVSSVLFCSVIIIFFYEQKWDYVEKDPRYNVVLVQNGKDG
jgi:hypothetical protein